MGFKPTNDKLMAVGRKHSGGLGAEEATKHSGGWELGLVRGDGDASP